MTDVTHTVEDVIIAFQKAVGRAWSASESAMQADPGIAGGVRQLFGVGQLNVDLACAITPHPETPDKLMVRLSPAAGTGISTLRFAVETRPVTAVDHVILTLAGLPARAEDRADLLLVATLLDARSRGIAGQTVTFELSRPGLVEPVTTYSVRTDVRGQAAHPLIARGVEAGQDFDLATRAQRLAEADRKTRILVRAVVQEQQDPDGHTLQTDWMEFTIDRPRDDGVILASPVSPEPLA